MGCGKSTVGKKLSQQINRPFFDLDKVIETLEEKTIADFFSEIGEEKFRAYEYQILQELLNNQKPSVIACGGGTPCYHNAMQLLSQQATTIYLQLSEEKLHERLYRKVAKRPLLQGQHDLRKYIGDLLTTREPIYKQSQLIIDTNNKSIAEIVEEICLIEK